MKICFVVLALVVVIKGVSDLVSYELNLSGQLAALCFSCGFFGFVLVLLRVCAVIHLRLCCSGYGCNGEIALVWYVSGCRVFFAPASLLEFTNCSSLLPRLIANLVEIVLSLWVLWRLRNIRDDYGIARELTVVRSGLTALFVFVFVVCGVLVRNPHCWL